MDSLKPYRTVIEPAWIDYNGHLRDAYYGVAFSLAIDDMMDQLGMDEAYRRESRCTLYTLETHCHFMHELKASDDLTVRMLVLDADQKRILAVGLFDCPRLGGHAAVAEAMLLHVSQGERPASAPFPATIGARLQELKQAVTPAFAAETPRSRMLELRRR